FWLHHIHIMASINTLPLGIGSSFFIEDNQQIPCLYILYRHLWVWSNDSGSSLTMFFVHNLYKKSLFYFTDDKDYIIKVIVTLRR
ncbi:hypothetical protein ACJX0J_041440, partial [Zea mays]